MTDFNSKQKVQEFQVLNETIHHFGESFGVTHQHFNCLE